MIILKIFKNNHKPSNQSKPSLGLVGVIGVHFSNFGFMSFCDRRGVAQRRFPMGCTEGQEALSGQAFDGDEWADW